MSEIEQIASGNAVAFRDFVKRKARDYYHVAYRVTLQKQAAEDAVQNAFAKLWEKRASLKADGNLEAWLYRVVINFAIDDKRRLRLSPLPDDVEQEAEPEKVDISQHLQSLPPRQRAAVMMVYFDEIPQKQAAENLGIGVKALESLLSRAKIILKEKLK